jgi:Uma2 family endonuclease
LVLDLAQGQKQPDISLGYVIWQESFAPFLAVELLSPGTETEDLVQTLRKSASHHQNGNYINRIYAFPSTSYLTAI